MILGGIIDNELFQALDNIEVGVCDVAYGDNMNPLVKKLTDKGWIRHKECWRTGILSAEMTQKGRIEYNVEKIRRRDLRTRRTEVKDRERSICRRNQASEQ